MRGNNRELVVVFSKDRPDRLEVILPHVQNAPHRIHVIDDSFSLSNRKKIKTLCEKYKLEYHGSREQRAILQQIGSETIGRFVEPLGRRVWSLGHNRNYALIYGSLLGGHKMIFMDDDVVVKPSLLRTIFGRLSKVPFVGTKITHMPDHSVVGHIYSACGDILPQYVSGTLIGIDLRCVRHYFLNIYNEDWIWLFLENNGGSVERIGSVKQLKYDPFQNWQSKIFFQEIGEIVWDGLFHSSASDRKSELLSAAYWEYVFAIRIQELKKITDLPLPEDLVKTAREIQQALFGFHHALISRSIWEIVWRYFHLLEEWRQLLVMSRQRGVERADDKNLR